MKFFQKFITNKTLYVLIIIFIVIIFILIYLLLFDSNKINQEINLNNSNQSDKEENLTFLQTSGQNIVDENDNVIFLKGVNFGSWLLWEGCALGILDCASWPEYKLRQQMEAKMPKEKVDLFFNAILNNFIQKEDFIEAKKLGLNFIRLGFHHRYVQENPTILDQAVGWAKEAGIYVILNMHAAPGAQAPAYFADSDGVAHLWASPQFQEEFINDWKILANRYKDEPTVAGYEILNEPDAVNGNQVTDLYQRAIATIRQTDNRHIIFLDGNHYAGDFSIFPKPLAENTVYVFHDYITTLAGLQNDINRNGYQDFQKKFNVPLMCNEFDDHYFYPFTDYFNVNNINWAPWQYKSLNNNPPFFGATADNRWRLWIEEINSKNNQDLLSKKSIANELINLTNNSQLSSTAKADLLAIINNFDNSKNQFNSLIVKYPNDSQELKRLKSEYDKLISNNNIIAANNFTDAVAQLSDQQIEDLAKSLQTQYFTNQ